jgi:hypothetical protein
MSVPLASSLWAHLRGSQRRPYLLASVSPERASVRLLRWAATYAGAEADAPHAATALQDPSDADVYQLIRARNDGGDVQINASYFGSATWTSVATATAGTPVALATRGDGVVHLLYVDSSSLKLQLRTSADYGATWSSATLLVTEASAISALALAASMADDALCAFYVLGSSTTLKRLRCSAAGVWESSGTNWTRSGSVASLSGVAAVHDGNDYAVMVTGTEVTTANPRVWATQLGDGNLVSLNAWPSLKAIAEADALSTVTFKAPALAQVGLSFAGFFVQSEAGDVAIDRVYYTHPPFLRGREHDLARAGAT